MDIPQSRVFKYDYLLFRPLVFMLCAVFSLMVLTVFCSPRSIGPQLAIDAPSETFSSAQREAAKDVFIGTLCALWCACLDNEVKEAATTLLQGVTRHLVLVLSAGGAQEPSFSSVWSVWLFDVSCVHSYHFLTAFLSLSLPTCTEPLCFGVLRSAVDRPARS